MCRLNWNVVMTIAQLTECRMDISVSDSIRQTIYTRRGRWYEDDLMELDDRIRKNPESEVEWVRYDSGTGVLEAGVLIRDEKR